MRSKLLLVLGLNVVFMSFAQDGNETANDSLPDLIYAPDSIFRFFSPTDSFPKYEYVVQEIKPASYHHSAPGIYEINDTLNGEVTSYYSDGYYDNLYPRYTVNYTDGLLNGPASIWTRDGKLLCKGQFENNRKTGLWKFYKNDTLAEVGYYDPKNDSSFINYDWCECFMDPPIDNYGLDTASIQELMSPGITPWFNVWDLRSTGRTGVWKFYDINGVLLEERDYK